MGAKFGKQSTATTESDKDATGKRDIQFLSTNDIQDEFNDIYERSNAALKSLIRNPCKELEQRITHCLENNPLQMGNCFPVMSSYQNCVTEDAVALMLERVAMIKEN